MMAVKAIRTISGAIWSCSRIMKNAIVMMTAGATAPTTLPVGVSPMKRATAPAIAPESSAATMKITMATMTLGR